MCYNGPGPGDTEDESEAVAPWERDSEDWKEPVEDEEGPDYWWQRGLDRKRERGEDDGA